MRPPVTSPGPVQRPEKAGGEAAGPSKALPPTVEKAPPAGEEAAKKASAPEKAPEPARAAPEKKPVAARPKPPQESPKPAGEPAGAAPEAPKPKAFDAYVFLPRLLPGSGQAGQWKVVSGTDAVASDSGELTKIYDGGDQWWVKRSVTSAAARGYQAEIDGKRRTVQLVVHRLTSAQAAVALYRDLCGQAPDSKPFTRTAAGATDGFAVSGCYVATVQIAPAYSEAQAAAADLLAFFLRRAPSLPQ